MILNDYEIKEYKGYTFVSKYIYRDITLSLKAKGILTLLFALPKDFDVSIKNLKRFTPEGEASIRSGLEELKAKCYLKVEPLRDKNGKFLEWVYIPYRFPYNIDEETAKKIYFSKVETDDDNLNVWVEDIPDTIQTNYHLYDPDVDFAGKGLLSYMFFLPPRWTFSRDNLAAKTSDGRDKVGNTIKELENLHYLIRKQLVDAKGHKGKMEYKFYRMPHVNTEEDTPVVENPSTDIPQLVNPQMENPQLVNRTHTNTNITNTCISTNTLSSSKTDKQVKITSSDPDKNETKKKINEKVNILIGDESVNQITLNLLINTMFDVYMSDSDVIRNCRKSYNKQNLINNFEALDTDGIKTMLIKIDEINPDVPVAMMLTLLTNGFRDSSRKNPKASYDTAKHTGREKSQASYDLDKYTQQSITRKLEYKRKTPKASYDLERFTERAIKEPLEKKKRNPDE